MKTNQENKGKLMLLFMDNNLMDNFKEYVNQSRKSFDKQIKVDYAINDFTLNNFFVNNNNFKDSTSIKITNILIVNDILKTRVECNGIENLDLNNIVFWTSKQELKLGGSIREFVDAVRIDINLVNHSNQELNSFIDTVEESAKTETIAYKTLFVFVPNNNYFIKFQECINYVNLLNSVEAENQQSVIESNHVLTSIRYHEFKSLDTFIERTYQVEEFVSKFNKIERVIFIRYDYENIFGKKYIQEILKESKYFVISPLDTPEQCMMIVKKHLNKAYKKDQFEAFNVKS